MTSLTDVLIREMDRAEKNGVEVFLSPDTGVYYEEGGVVSSGFFSSTSRLIKVACGLPVVDWFSVFLHETSHMDQWIEGTEIWKAAESPGSDKLDNFFSWLDGKDIPDDPWECALTVAMLEMDAEIRTTEKIRRYSLEKFIDPKVYSQKSNAYCYFYVWSHRHRRWYDEDTRPYMVEDIWRNAPDVIDGELLKEGKIPAELEAAFYRNLRR